MNNNQYMKKIEEELGALGLKQGGIVLLHSNVEALGDIAGGVETVVKGIELALGQHGTLLMPVLTLQQVDGVENDEFSAKDTASESGTLSEHFRKMPGVERSINPTHSVCGRGRFVQEMIGAHHLDNTPCGPHSPYKLLSEIGGQILFIGCDLNVNTSLHGVEELVEPEYLFGETMKYRVFNGKREKTYIDCKRYNTANITRRYERLVDLLEVGKTLKIGKVLGTTCYLLDAKAMWKVASEKLKEDPNYFVDVK